MDNQQEAVPIVYTSEAQILELQRRVLAKEEVSPEELRAGIDFCRNQAGKRSAAKKEQAAADKKSAISVPKLDIGAVFAKLKADKEAKAAGG